MSRPIHLITGAAGLLGSHIAEQLCQAGESVRALVRPGRDATFLRGLGAEIFEGDIRDADVVNRAVRGSACVYHCAAKVGDWGPWKSFEENTVQVAKSMAAACRQEGVDRLIHVSSLAVYGLTNPGETIDEETPTGRRFMLWDYYGRAKWLAENFIREFPKTTIVRPCWIVGPRDHITVARVVPAIVNRTVPIIGSGANHLSLLNAGDAAAAAILAANQPKAIGEVYNLCQEDRATQCDVFNLLTDMLGVPRLTRHIPYFLAFRFGFVAEVFGRLLRWQEPPAVNRFVVRLIGSDCAQFNVGKVRAHLGWSPRIDTLNSVRIGVEWFCGLPENRHLHHVLDRKTGRESFASEH